MSEHNNVIQVAIDATLKKIFELPTFEEIDSICMTSNDIRNRTCKLCNKVFKTVKIRKSHNKKATCQKIKPNPCECRRCFKIFPTAHSKRCHMSRRTCKAILPPPLPQIQQKVSKKRSVSETKKKYVASLQDWKCGHCKDKLTAWFEVDHTKRLEYGGSNEVDNLVALCRNCHGRKTAFENM